MPEEDSGPADDADGLSDSVAASESKHDDDDEEESGERGEAHGAGVSEAEDGEGVARGGGSDNEENEQDARQVRTYLRFYDCVDVCMSACKCELTWRSDAGNAWRKKACCCAGRCTRCQKNPRSPLKLSSDTHNLRVLLIFLCAISLR